MHDEQVEVTMKKFLCGLAFLLVAGFASAQTIPVWVMWSSSWVRWDGGPVGNGSVGPYSGTPASGDIIYFNGVNWVSLNAPSNGAYNVTWTSKVPSWTAASGSTPTGTGFFHITGGVADGAARAVVLNTADATGAPCVPNVTTACVFDDFTTNVSSSNAAVNGSFFRCNSTGTSAGCDTDTAAASITDANSFGIWTCDTGSTTTGLCAIAGMGYSASATNKSGGLLVSGGEVFQARIYIPTASNGTQTFSTCVGLFNSGSITDTINICWDNNTSTDWVIQTEKGGTATTSTSNTVATAAAWHTLNITVNSNATSVAFSVDGTALNVSPITTNIPTTVATVPNALRLTSSAGTSSKLGSVDYCYFMKPVTR